MIPRTHYYKNLRIFRFVRSQQSQLFSWAPLNRSQPFQSLERHPFHCIHYRRRHAFHQATACAPYRGRIAIHSYCGLHWPCFKSNGEIMMRIQRTWLNKILQTRWTTALSRFITLPQYSGSFVLQFKVFVLPIFTPNTFTSRTIVIGEISTLAHETWKGKHEWRSSEKCTIQYTKKV